MCRGSCNFKASWRATHQNATWYSGAFKRSPLVIVCLLKATCMDWNLALCCGPRTPLFIFKYQCMCECTCQVFVCWFFRALQPPPPLSVSLPHSQSPLCQAQVAPSPCIYPFHFLPLFIPSSCCRCLSPSWLLASAQVGSLPRRMMTACIAVRASGAERPQDLIFVRFILFTRFHSKWGRQKRSEWIMTVCTSADIHFWIASIHFVICDCIWETYLSKCWEDSA